MRDDVMVHIVIENWHAMALLELEGQVRFGATIPRLSHRELATYVW